MKKTPAKTLSLVCGLTLCSLAATSVQAAVNLPANTVSFSQSTSINALSGENLTVDLIGSNFTVGPDGAAFSLSWDPSVLSYVGTAVANPPWDASSVNDNSNNTGLIDFVFLGKSVGNAGLNFALASFSFNVIGAAGTSSSLSVSIDPYNVGFVSPGAVPIDVNYVNSQVQVVSAVPVPAAVWLFGTGLVGLLGAAQKRKFAIS